jgi:hypothetical protein
MQLSEIDEANTMCFKVLLTLVLAFSCFTANATKEGPLSLGVFHVESLGLDESGPVSISGLQARDDWQSLSINAFGKSFSLSKAELDLLRGVSANTIQLSYAAGVGGLGKASNGRHLNIVFSNRLLSTQQCASGKAVPSSQTSGKIVFVYDSGVVEIANW